MTGLLKALRAAIALYAALRPSGRTLIRIAWDGLDDVGRQIFAREIRGAIAPAWETAKQEASDHSRQGMAAGGRIALPVGDLTDEEIDLIARSGPADRRRRAEDVRAAIGSARIEGRDITPWTRAVLGRYVRGEITAEEAMATVLDKYGPTKKAPSVEPEAE